PPPLEDNAGAEGAGLDAKIGPQHRRAEIGPGGAPAAAAMDGHVHAPETLLLVSVHIGGERIAGLLPGGDEGIEERVLLASRRHVQRAAVAAIGIAPRLAGLRPLEIGEDMRVGPFRQAVAGPTVVV